MIQLSTRATSNTIELNNNKQFSDFINDLLQRLEQQYRKRKGRMGVGHLMNGSIFFSFVLQSRYLGDPGQGYPNELGMEEISFPFFLFSSCFPSRLVLQ